MKLLIDVNMSPAWVAFLSDAGHDALHWTSVGNPSAADDVIVRYAIENDFTILTRDLDFGAILATTGAPRPSVIQFRGPRQFPLEIGGRVLAILDQLHAQTDAGAFVTVDLLRTRFRLLPLNRPQ